MMANACTWIGCEKTKDTVAMLDAGRAWAHLCPKHKALYEAELTALRAKGALALPGSSRALTIQAAGGEEAWRRYVFGPFAKGRDKPKILAGTTDEPAKP